MVICPSCQAENRSGARYCKSCAAALPALPAVTKPLKDPATIRWVHPGSDSAHTAEQEKRTGTRPLSGVKGFIRRPSGAIFGDRFLYQRVIYSSSGQHRYLVTAIPVSSQFEIRTCPNPACGAIFPPYQEPAEKFCTQCGALLEVVRQEYLLLETAEPVPQNIALLVGRGLAHSHVRAPLMIFEEQLGDQARRCLLLPSTQILDGAPPTEKVLEWGIGLAHGLDYLHDNGVTFNGRLDSSTVGLANERAVWADFTSCQIYSDENEFDQRADVRALAMLLFYWMTGRMQYEHDPNLLPAPRSLFEKALLGPGFSSAGEFAEALEQVFSQISPTPLVDYQIGRRTDVGMVRNLNEDSILSLELNKTIQSISQSLGLFIVADGMGGHTAGEIASSTIVNTIARKALDELLPGRFLTDSQQNESAWLQGAVQAANQEVFSLRKTSGSDMGSTLVCTLLDGLRATIAHVGDSRAYRINAKGLQQITVDHSLVERLIATNQITRQEARRHPQRNVIYRTIGDKMNIDVDITTLDLTPNDYLLLCSDGLSGMIEDELIEKIVRQAQSPQAACDQLIEAANRAGGEDNISVILIKVIEV